MTVFLVLLVAVAAVGVYGYKKGWFTSIQTDVTQAKAIVKKEVAAGKAEVDKLKK